MKKKIDSKEMEKRALLHMAQKHYKESERYANQLEKLAGKKSKDWIWECIGDADSYENFIEKINR